MLAGLRADYREMAESTQAAVIDAAQSLKRMAAVVITAMVAIVLILAVR